MNISAINSTENRNYVMSYRGAKTNPQEAAQVIRKAADIVENGAENSVPKQPFKIPECVQKFAKKVYDFTIKVLDTF